MPSKLVDKVERDDVLSIESNKHESINCSRNVRIFRDKWLNDMKCISDGSNGYTQIIIC